MKTLLSLLAMTLLTLAWPLDAQAAARKPNVIVLLTDDNGYGDHHCLGNPVLKTPAFDRLHSQSVRFTDFHVSPMCTPTRGQLMTGLDALHNRAASVSHGRSFMRPDLPTMADIFAASGYHTGLFGKWHLGDSYPNLPNQRGFREAVSFRGWGITCLADLWNNDYFDGRFEHNGVVAQYPGYCTDVWFNLTMDYIKERKAKNEPFFVYLPTNAAHDPHWVPEEYRKPYEGLTVNGNPVPAAFFGMIANIDKNLDRLDDFLKKNGLFDDTILIYMNDNGGTAGTKVFNAGMKGHKTQYYEGGHRAACFVRWPGGSLQKPCDLDKLTNVQDILPTLIELCELKKPDAAKFDGRSLAGLLRGTDKNFPDRTLVVQYGKTYGNPLAKGDCAVMWKKWRLLKVMGEKGPELYDLNTDPGQATNVAGQNPAIVKQLSDHYKEWWAGIEPTLYDYIPVRIGSDKENPVRLSAADWTDAHCDGADDVRLGKHASGAWHLKADQDGTYEIELRRYPREVDAAIVAGVPEFQARAGKLPKGVPLPIVKVRYKIGKVEATKAVTKNDRGITFSVPLKAGSRTTLQSWFYDADGKEICGAYYAYVTRK